MNFTGSIFATNFYRHVSKSGDPLITGWERKSVTQVGNLVSEAHVCQIPTCRVCRSRKRLLEDFTLWEMMSLTAARFSVNICIRVSDCTAQVEFCWRLDTCTDTRGGQCSVAPFLPRTLLETAERFVNVCVCARACVCVCFSPRSRRRWAQRSRRLLDERK